MKNEKEIRDRIEILKDQIKRNGTAICRKPYTLKESNSISIRELEWVLDDETRD